MRTDEAYIRSLERRIRNQRMQLRWWQNKFERADLTHRRPPFSQSAVAKINGILKRRGPWRVSANGTETRRMPLRRTPQESSSND